MRTILIIAVVFVFIGLAEGQEKKPDASVKSVDSVVEADVSAGDPRGIDDETDVTGLIDALQRKEQELQSALDEIMRLRAWIEKIKAASESEQAKMHYNMGCMYKLYKQYEKAEGAFLKALSISPDDPNIHYNLGILYEDDLGNNEGARKHYKRFLELSRNEQDKARVQEWLSSLH